MSLRIILPLRGGEGRGEGERILFPTGTKIASHQLFLKNLPGEILVALGGQPAEYISHLSPGSFPMPSMGKPSAAMTAGEKASGADGTGFSTICLALNKFCPALRELNRILNWMADHYTQLRTNDPDWRSVCFDMVRRGERFSVEFTSEEGAMFLVCLAAFNRYDIGLGDYICFLEPESINRGTHGF